jgi:hypothetical protein
LKFLIKALFVIGVLAGIILGLLIASPTAAQSPTIESKEINPPYGPTIPPNYQEKKTDSTDGYTARGRSRQQLPENGGGRHTPPNCEQYRAVVQRYFGDQTDTALFVASKESGCRMEAVSKTADYCLFQINKEPATGKDVELCVRRAWEKFVGGRVGSNNWSAWYAVCSPGNNPQPKYSGIKCQ